MVRLGGRQRERALLQSGHVSGEGHALLLAGFQGDMLPLDAVKKTAKAEALDDKRKLCVFKAGDIAYEVAAEK